MNHLRGRVRQSGRRAFGKPVYVFDVVNEITGEVVASDNHCAFSKAHDDVYCMVLVARGAWMYDLRRKQLREKA